MLSFLSIKRCLLCGFFNKSPVCQDCIRYLPEIPENTCNCCKGLLNTTTKQCKHCDNGQNQFDKLYCKFNYSWPLNKILQQLKYHGKTTYAKGLGYLLSQTLEPITYKHDLIIPTPLHKNRLRTRGFNQVELLLKYQAKAIQNKVNTNLISRVKDTKPQTLTAHTERSHNLQGAFTLHQQVHGLNILIVDDVITTGATVNSLASQLKENGAKLVEVCSLMRVV